MMSSTNGMVTASRPSTWFIITSAAAVLTITMGVRQTFGLFVLPLHTAIGLGIASISFAMAVGQLLWGAAQPFFGVLADKWGSYRVIVLGAILLAAGLALTTVASSEWSLLMTIGVLSAVGAGAGSFSILMGVAAGAIPPERRSVASGFINAGGSVGQFIFAPLSQTVISHAGWAWAMLALSAAALFTIPIAWPLREGSTPTRIATT